jgi:hypothetical protein
VFHEFSKEASRCFFFPILNNPSGDEHQTLF